MLRIVETGPDRLVRCHRPLVFPLMARLGAGVCVGGAIHAWLGHGDVWLCSVLAGVFLAAAAAAKIDIDIRLDRQKGEVTRPARSIIRERMRSVPLAEVLAAEVETDTDGAMRLVLRTERGVFPLDAASSSCLLAGEADAINASLAANR